MVFPKKCWKIKECIQMRVVIISNQLSSKDSYSSFLDSRVEKTENQKKTNKKTNKQKEAKKT